MCAAIRLAGLFSGGASTLRQIYLATLPGNPLHGRVEIPIIIGSSESAPGFQNLRNAGFYADNQVCDPRHFSSPEQFGDRLNMLLGTHNITWFGQYGWLPRTPENVIAEFAGINQHPALTPHFGGKGFYSRTPHAAALYFARLAQIWTTYPVAQRVHAEYDKGEILAATPVQIYQDDDVETLQKRVLPYEWLTQITALLRICDASGPLPEFISPPYTWSDFRLSLLEEARARALRDYPRG